MHIIALTFRDESELPRSKFCPGFPPLNDFPDVVLGVMATHTLAAAVLALASLACSQAGASSSGSDCLGEYIEDSRSGECVLAANAGDEDEPMASHRKCAANEFLCPDRVTCVADAHTYAACATGFPEEAPLLTLAAERAAAASAQELRPPGPLPLHWPVCTAHSQDFSRRT